VTNSDSNKVETLSVPYTYLYSKFSIASSPLTKTTWFIKFTHQSLSHTKKDIFAADKHHAEDPVIAHPSPWELGPNIWVLLGTPSPIICVVSNLSEMAKMSFT